MTRAIKNCAKLYNDPRSWDYDRRNNYDRRNWAPKLQCCHTYLFYTSAEFFSVVTFISCIQFTPNCRGSFKNILYFHILDYIPKAFILINFPMLGLLHGLFCVVCPQSCSKIMWIWVARRDRGTRVEGCYHPLSAYYMPGTGINTLFNP